MHSSLFVALSIHQGHHLVGKILALLSILAQAKETQPELRLHPLMYELHVASIAPFKVTSDLNFGYLR
jgi:hypothetical protein